MSTTVWNSPQDGRPSSHSRCGARHGRSRIFRHWSWRSKRPLMAGNAMAFGMLFPRPYVLEMSRLRQQLEEAHLAWATEWKLRQQEFVIENIRFAHDPHWKQR